MSTNLIMDLEGLDSCNICMETYDGNARPHSFPCGHTLCSCCVTNSIKGNYLKCPHCQRSHNATSVNDFPINYGIETLIDKLREAKRETVTKVATSPKKATSLKSRTNEIISEQKNCLRSMVKVSESMCSDIEEFKKFLQGRKKKHQEVAVKISTLLQLNEELIKQVESEEKRIDIIAKEGEEYKREANENLSCDENLSEMLDLVNVSEKLEKIYKTLENWNDKCKMHLPCKEVISSLAKIEIGLEDVLSVVNTNESATSSVLQEQHDSFPSPMEKVLKIQAVTDSDNSELKKSVVKFLLRRGEVGLYAVQVKEGQIRHSRVTAKDGQSYLHRLQDVRSLKMAYVKIEIGLEDVLSVVNTNEESATSSVLQEQHDSFPSPMEKVLKIQANSELKKSVKFLLRRGEVHAVQVKEGQIRHSRVTAKDGKIYLHCLQDGMSPKMAFFKHSDLMETLNKESVVAFLDLSWEGSIQGRVHILLSPDTPLARHFKALCSGELGPSYKNTKFLEVIEKGDSNYECLEGGDYEKNDGSGGAPLFTGLIIDDIIYNHKYSIGVLQAAHYGNDGPRSAQFRIYTGTQVNEGSIIDGKFGQVQDGLDVVRNAVKLDDIKKVTISDCGIVLPL